MPDQLPSQSLAARLLTSPLPDDRGGRLMLLALRCMGAHGLNDAAIVHHFVNGFGVRFRRPLLLTRLVVQQLSECAGSAIQIAPGCCPRMTAAESAIIGAAASALHAPEKARLLIADLLDSRHPDACLAAISAMAGAYFDAALPIGGWRR